MNVKLAETAGFCYGVERAVTAVYDEIGSGDRKIYTYGPIVHNDTVTDELAEKGVIGSAEELKKMASSGELDGAAVIIRAHGVGRDILQILQKAEGDVKVIDATCPFVKKIHNAVIRYREAGEKILVTGTASHPEVIGILGQIDNDAVVIETIQEAEAFCPEEKQKYCLVSQTTFNVQKFQDIVAILKKKVI